MVSRAALPTLLPCCNSALWLPPARSPQQQTVGQLLAHVRQLCDRLEAQAEVSYVQADGTKVGGWSGGARPAGHSFMCCRPCVPSCCPRKWRRRPPELGAACCCLPSCQVVDERIEEVPEGKSDED